MSAGDDLQLQGDLAVQNAEVRGVLRVGGRLVGPGTPQPPFPPTGTITVQTIYVRAVGGSDQTGNGSLARPYATNTFAVDQVPTVPPRGLRVIIDSDVFEPLPPGYCIPSITFPVMDYSTDSSTPYYYSGAGLIFRSTPKLATTIPAADAVIGSLDGAVISADPSTNLITLTIAVARPSWTTANLKGKHLLRTVGSFLANSSIRSATPTTLVITNSAGFFNGGVGPLVLALGETINIVQPAAGFIGGADVTVDIGGSTFASFVSTCNSVGFQGWSFTQPGSGFPISVGILNCPQVTFELCDIEGLTVQGDAGSYWAYLTGCTVYGAFVGAVNSSVFCNQSWLHDIELFYPANGTPQGFTDCILDDCASFASVSIRGVPIIAGAAFRNVQINNSSAGFSDSPTGDGIYWRDGGLSLDHVQVNGAKGNGVLCERGSGYAKVSTLTGTGNGAGGVGVGLRADDGVQVQLLDTATTITGIDGDLKVGALVVRAWGTAPAAPVGNFYFDAPVGQEYDLAGVNAGATAATCTGTRAFIKP